MKIFTSLVPGVAAMVFAFSTTTGFGATITIGQTIDLSGGSAEHGKSLQRGAMLAIEAYNAKVTSKGTTIRLLTLDDGGDSKRARENAAKLIEKDGAVALFLGAEGGPCIAQTALGTELKVPVIGCAAGAPELRAPFNRYSFPVRAAHLSEFEKIVNTALSFGESRFAFVRSDSANGQAHAANVKRLVEKAGGTLVAEILMNKEFSVAAAAKTIETSKAQVVLNHGGYKVFGELYLATRNLKPAPNFMPVNSGAQQMVRQIGEKARGVIFTQVVPFPWLLSMPIVGEYQSAWKQTYPNDEMSFSSMEGFIAGMVLAEAVKRAKSPTAEGLIAALESFGATDIHGFPVRFGPNDRTGSSFVDTVIANARGSFNR